MTSTLVLIIAGVLAVLIVLWGVVRNAAETSASRRALATQWPIQYFTPSTNNDAKPTSEVPAVAVRDDVRDDSDATNPKPPEGFARATPTPIIDDKTSRVRHLIEAARQETAGETPAEQTGKFFIPPNGSEDPDRTGQIRTGGN